jgi:hypothetical protein
MTGTKEKIKIVTAIICDDIRREQSGKDILIGVYGSGIRVVSLPQFVTLCVWLEIKPLERGSIEFKLRLIGQNKAVLFESPSAKATFNELKNSHAAIGGIAVQLQSAGPHELQISTGSEEWMTIRNFDVEVGQKH